MSKLFFLCTLIAVPGAFASFHQIKCRGYVSFDVGTMQGMSEVTLEKGSDGNWMMNDFIPVGKNLSENPSFLYVDSYSNFLTCHGGTAKYDSTSKTLEFRYKYDSGFLGGGCQKTRGTFKDCRDR